MPPNAKTAWSWSEKGFCERVTRRCKELGRSRRSALKEAGLSHDYLHRPPKHGRQIGHVLQLGKVLDMDPRSILGLPPAGLNVDIFRLAFETACEIMHGQPRNDALFVRALAMIYRVLMKRPPADSGFG